MTAPTTDPAPRRPRPFRHRRDAIGVVIALAVTGVLVTGCAISTEQQPRPITRETTVVPTTVDGN